MLEVENYDKSILKAALRLLNDEHLDFSQLFPSPQTSVTENFRRGRGSEFSLGEKLNFKTDDTFTEAEFSPVVEG